MDRFGIGKVGLPGFGVGEFRLPVFGGGSGRGSGDQWIPEPDVYYDLSLKDNSSPTRNIMDDLSGNGHDAEIFNAAYALGSGYGKYATDFNNWQKVEISSFTRNTDTINITNVVDANRILYISNISFNLKIKVSGTTSDMYPSFKYGEDWLDCKTDGEYTLKANNVEVSLAFRSGVGDCDITITQIPDYKGAFVFDGVDDYAIMQNVTKGFKTLFVEVVPLNLDATMYDQRINSSYTNFSIINKSGYVAYEYNNKGLTYINGKLNTTILTDNLLNKRQIITATNDVQSDCKTIYIGCNYLLGSFSNMALYKLIGFYDELTPLQIEKVIQKYNLKFDE